MTLHSKMNQFRHRPFTWNYALHTSCLVLPLLGQSWSSSNVFVNESTSSTSAARIKVNILRLSTGLIMDYAMSYALELARSNTTLNSTFEFVPTTKTSERALTKGIGPTLRVLIESVSVRNLTYAFLVGPDYSAEAQATAQLTPMYNLVSLTGACGLNAISDKSAFPLIFRAGPKSADFTQGILSVVKSLNIAEITTMAVNEAYFVDGIRSLEQRIDKIGVKLQYSGVYDSSNRKEIIDSIVKMKPNYIANALYGTTEPQFYCDLHHAGLSSPERTIYLIFGPFGAGNWWIPKPGDATMHCTWLEMSTLLNGSLAVETFYDDTSDPDESNRTKIGGVNGWQLNAGLLKYEEKPTLASRVSAKYATYDSMWSAFDALYRTERRMRLELNASLANALASDCKSDAYKQYVSVFVQELKTTKFYGCTGDFAYDKNQDRILELGIYQFQANVTDVVLIRVGTYSVKNESSTIYHEKLRFATPDNTPPHVWAQTVLEQQTQAVRQQQQQARIRFTIIVSVLAAAAVAGIAVAVTFLYSVKYRRYTVHRKRKRQLSDSRWVILATTINYNTQRKSRLSTRAMSQQSIPSTITSSVAFQGESDRGQVRIGDSNPPQEVWLRKFPKVRVHGVLAAKTETGANVARLVELFPQAQALYGMAHININRFMGICVDTHDDDTLLFYDYAPKSSLRELLHNEAFTLDLGLKHGFVYDIVSAVQFVHSRAAVFGGGIGFLHCNNIVLDNKFTAKLTDYAFWNTRPASDFTSLIDESSLASLTDEQLSNALSRAPEILVNGLQRGNERRARKSKEKTDDETSKPCMDVLRADIYSLGMVYVELFTRGLPFGVDPSPRDPIISVLLEQVKYYRLASLDATITTRITSLAPEFVTDIDMQVRRLIMQCSSIVATARPNANDIAKAIRQLPNYSAGSVVENLIDRLQSYAKNLEDVVAERTTALVDEMSRSEQLLLQILPRSVAIKLKAGEAVEPEMFDEVSIYFSDIVGFTAISSHSTPMEVVALLNSLYTLFDSVLENFDAYKVETIGDAYMVASGLPIRNGNRHLIEIADMASKLLTEIQTFRISDSSQHQQRLMLRIGLHTGPCVAGVVGIKMPRYCLFGDTVNMASRMESTGQALKIHISEDFKQALDENFPVVYKFAERGITSVKGKGEMRTFWLVQPELELSQRILTHTNLGAPVSER